jgi:pimeloyl-ACP methyl ester carboxylesterase
MYKFYIKNEQFNFQINRFMEPYQKNAAVQKNIASAVKQITDQESWFTTWDKEAKNAEAKQLYDLASAYYQMADFFLSENDSRKLSTYRRFKKNYYNSIDTSMIRFDKVPYEVGAMSVAYIEHPGATQTLIFQGGFDSYLEELIRLTLQQGLYEQLSTYNFILFEGPGQGETLRSGVPLTDKWEKPIAAILDFYQLESADLLGMSLGGYLVARAAAFEPRIKKVICFDVLYNMFDALLMRIPNVEKMLDQLDDSSVQEKLNTQLIALMEQNIDLAFLMGKGMDLTFSKRPVEFVLEMRKYTMAGNLDKIRQDVLLLGCTKDLYVPAKTTAMEAEQLINARSVTTKLFTERSGGERHCQVGDKPLAAKAIIGFLNDTF